MICVKTAGGSMRPLIKNGDFVMIETGVKQYHPGDAVLYELAGQKFIHRISKIHDGHITIIDDAGVIFEHQIPISCLIGRQVTFINGQIGVIYNKTIKIAYFIYKNLMKLITRFKRIIIYTPSIT
jgi:hypothetical protein